MQDLRDKLLKAGAIDKKQARKARTEARKQQKKRKQGRKVDVGREQEQQQRERFEARQAQQREEARRRQAELNREAERRAQQARVRDLIRAHAVRERPSGNLAERPFYFVAPDRRIRRIHVSNEVARRLASGLLVIVDPGEEPGAHALVDAEGGQRLEELAPERILFWCKEDDGDLPTYGGG